MMVLVFEIILSVSAILMAVLLIRASTRVEAISQEEIDQYSLSPHIEKVRNSFFEVVYDFIISFFKGILHALASLSKHTHLLSTRSIAKIEKAINSAEEEVEENIERLESENEERVEE